VVTIRAWVAAGLAIAMSTMSGGLSARPKKSAPEAPPQAVDLTEAQQRFQRALELYEEGNLDGARAELQRAYDLAPNYKLHYNLGQVAFELRDYPAALASFERYLAEGGSKVPEARRSQVEKDIEKLRTRIASVDIAANVPNAEVSIDDIAIGATPLGKPIVVGAGRHKIAVSKNGYVADTRWVDLAGGDTTRIAVSLAEIASPSPVGPPPTGSRPPAADDQFGLATAAEAPAPAPAAWIGWTVAGSLALGAAVMGGLAYSASRDLRDARDRMGVSRAELDRQQSKVRGFALASDICAGASVVAVGVSLWATFSRRPVRNREERAAVRLVPGIETIRLEGAF
jgi:hypothetical protein